jgi:flagellar biosynthesis/type III secretory pathway M-ring protein FliF/YscJ
MLSGQENMEVELLQVAWSPPVEPEAPPPSSAARLRKWAMANLVPLVMVFILVISVYLIYVQARRALPSEEMELPPEESVAMEAEISESDQAMQQFEALRGKVDDIVAEDPKKAASIVRRWMTKENY